MAKVRGSYTLCTCQQPCQGKLASCAFLASAASLPWLASHWEPQRTGIARRCQIVHAHEWGGVFADLVTLNHFRQVQPGLRIAVEPHGGHVWSQLGEANRPMDVYALRIDSNERSTNALNDVEISPTKYMLAYLRQRGWALPNDTVVIPNIVPDADKHALAAVVEKKASSPPLPSGL